jgi:hypothetical protein
VLASSATYDDATRKPDGADAQLLAARPTMNAVLTTIMTSDIIRDGRSTTDALARSAKANGLEHTFAGLVRSSRKLLDELEQYALAHQRGEIVPLSEWSEADRAKRAKLQAEIARLEAKLRDA